MRSTVSVSAKKKHKTIYAWNKFPCVLFYFNDSSNVFMSHIIKK